MKAYSVRQIAEKLGTNPETVRRWIRDGKLKAVQISRKSGNQVSEAELKKFLEQSPKYLTKLGIATAALPPALRLGTIAGGLIAGILVGINAQQNMATHVKREDLIVFIAENISKLDATLLQKEKLIEQTRSEIADIQNQIKQYQYLLEHEDEIMDALKLAESETKGKEDA